MTKFFSAIKNGVVFVAQAIAETLNPQQWKVVGSFVFATTGPLAIVLNKHFGLGGDELKMWMDFIAAITTSIGGAIILKLTTNKAQVQAVAQMPVEQKIQAIANIPAPAFAQIAEALPDEAKVEAVLAMPPAATAAAVAQLSLADQASIVAALPDAAVVTAAGLMPGVEVKVGEDASASALEAAHDDNVPGVTPV